MPVVTSGVQITGAVSHIVFKNITVIHVINDGFALTTGDEKGSKVYGIVYENIAAIECCDDGYSSHGDCQELMVNGFRAEGCSTGVCNCGGSSVFDNFTTKNIHGVDVYYLSGRHILKNSRIEAHGNVSPLQIAALAPSYAATYPAWNSCTVQIENVLFDGAQLPADGSSKVFIRDRCTVDMKRTTFNKISWFIYDAALVSLHKSLITGGNSYSIQLMPEAKWQADENIYDLDHISVGQISYTAQDFDAYKKATGQDMASKWMSVPFDELIDISRQPTDTDKAIGCDMSLLP